MNRKITRWIAGLIAILLLLATYGGTLAENDSTSSVPEVNSTVGGITKYGIMKLSLTGTDFLALGYTYGDVVDVTVHDQTYEMPVVTSLTDMGPGHRDIPKRFPSPGQKLCTNASHCASRMLISWSISSCGSLAYCRHIRRRKGLDPAKHSA